MSTATAGELQQVRKQAIAEARMRPAKTAMAGSDIVLARRVPAKAWFNAKAMGEDPQNDEGYMRDMEKRYPEMRVGYTPRKTSICMMTPAHGPRLGRMTRFGRATSLR